MSDAVLVATARLAPGGCFISGDHNGPFIDTSRDLYGHGRVYLSIKALGPLMREAGWLPKSEVEDALATVEEYDRLTADLQAEAQGYRNIVAALEDLLPAPEPVVQQVGIFQDLRVGEENDALKAEVAELRTQLEAASQVAAAPTPEGEGSVPVEAGAAAPPETPTVTVADQEVDVVALLDRSAQDVVAVAEDWPAEARQLLVDLEEVRRGAKARKTVLALAPAGE